MPWPQLQSLGLGLQVYDDDDYDDDDDDYYYFFLHIMRLLSLLLIPGSKTTASAIVVVVIIVLDFSSSSRGKRSQHSEKLCWPARQLQPVQQRMPEFGTQRACKRSSLLRVEGLGIQA